MVQIIGSPLSLEYEIVYDACHREAFDYSTYGSAANQVGERTEEAIFSLARGLDCKSYLSPKGSCMDCELKGDLILEVETSCLIWQVKTSQTGADSFLKKRSSFRGERYPLPGVLVPDNQSVLSSVLALAEASGVSLKPSLIKAIKLHEELKGKSIPLGVVPSLDKIFTKKVRNAICFLGLGRIEKGSTLILRG